MITNLGEKSSYIKKLGVIFVLFLVSFIMMACDNDVPATSIVLSEETLELVVGETKTVTAEVLPEDATDKTVTWSSDDTSIATVENGEIEAISAGSAEITASCGNVSATLTVVVSEPEPEVYTVSFDENGGSKVDDQEIIAGQKATKPEDPTKKDHTFAGWFTDDAFTTEFDFTSPINADITLHAKWLEHFEVLFYADGIEYIEPLEVVEGDLIVEPNVRKDGYVLAGWYLDLGFTNEFDLSTPVTSDLVLYGKWVEVYTYSISYNLNGGENHPDNNITKYSIFDLPITLHEPVKEGYKFLGWYSNKYFTAGPYDEINYGKNYNLYARWAIADKVDTYANPALAGTTEGSTVTYNGMEFVFGTTAFASLSEAVAASTRNVYIVGTHEDDITITLSGISLIGPNANIDPNSDNRNDEAIIKGKITVASGVENFTINGLAFTETGRVTGSGLIKNVKFIYNYVYDTVEATTNWLETSGYTSGFFAFSSSNNNQLMDFTFKYNKFSNVSDVNINFIRVTNVYVENNTFLNFDRDAIRFDTGGFNQGNLVFDNNVFSNDAMGGYNGIYFRIYGGDQVVPTSIEITDNTFKNIGQIGRETYSGAISMRNYQEKDTEIKILYNTFETCANYIHLRNNATAYNHQNYPWAANANYNKFIGIPETYYHRSWTGSDNEVTNPEKMNFEYNLFIDDEGNVITDLSSYDDKIMNVASYENNYQTKEEYEEMYNKRFEGMPTKIEITNPINELAYLEEYQIELTLSPEDANDDVVFYSSNPNVLSVSEEGKIKALALGSAVITVASNLDEDIFTTLEVEVIDKERVEVRYEGNGALLIGQTLQLNYQIYGSDKTNITWTSSDNDIATVDANGLVTAKSSGTVIITAALDETNVKAEVGLTIYGNEITDEFLLYLIGINTGVVSTQELYYIGSDDGSGDYLNRIYTSVSDYHFGDFEIIKNMLSEDAPNWDGREIDIQFITIHDTAGSGSGSTAQANSGWCTNPNNRGSSWHYTVGNDGVYQQIEDNIRAWHAGDGNREFQLLDTGVKAEGEGEPVIAINKKGYYTINGVQSNIKAPEIAQIAELGIYTTIGKNGNYWMNKTYFNTSYRTISNYGGNNNSIGIESAVNNGSDVYFTWHRLAKLVASLLKKHDLGLDRVMYHNNFSGKPCPRSMMTADLVPEFETLVKAEYDVATKYSDYEIEFVSHNPDIVDNTGRVIGRPLETTNVTYTITVTKDGNSESITLNALIPGQYTW